MNNCNSVRNIKTCNETVVASASESFVAEPCPPVNTCLGLGRSIAWDGACLSVVNSYTVADGWYGSFRVEDGCITEVGDSPVYSYTPAPCAPNPAPCSGGSSGGGGNSTVDISPDACNLLSNAGGMLSAKLYLGESSGVTVSGCGSASNPLRMVVSSESNTIFVKSGSPAALSVSGDGSQSTPYTISLSQVTLDAGWHGAYKTDEYGRVVDFDDTRESLIKGVANGDGVSLSVSGGVLTADLQDVTGKVSGQYTTGGYVYTIDTKGRVTNVRRDITINSGVYQFGKYKVTLNGFGSVTKLEETSSSGAYSPDTFVGSFKGDASSTDTAYAMSIDTALDGPLYVEWRGYLGVTDSTPGIINPLPRTYSILVDNVAITDAVAEVTGAFFPGGVGRNIISAAYGVTTNYIAAGNHTITITAPDSSLTRRDGIMTVRLVGKGA